MDVKLEHLLDHILYYPGRFQICYREGRQVSDLVGLA